MKTDRPTSSSGAVTELAKVFAGGTFDERAFPEECYQMINIYGLAASRVLG
jgi:hypothetical protein